MSRRGGGRRWKVDCAGGSFDGGFSGPAALDELEVHSLSDDKVMGPGVFATRRWRRLRPRDLAARRVRFGQPGIATPLTSSEGAARAHAVGGGED